MNRTASGALVLVTAKRSVAMVLTEKNKQSLSRGEGLS